MSSEAFSMHLGTRLRLIREAQGMEQRELARRSGVPRTSLCNIERNKRIPRTNDFVALITVLGVSPHMVLCGSETWEPEKVAI